MLSISDIPNDVYPIIVSYLPQVHILSKKYRDMSKCKRDNILKIRENLSVFVNKISDDNFMFVPTFNYWVKDCVVGIQTDRFMFSYIRSVSTYYTDKMFDNSECESDNEYNVEDFLCDSGDSNEENF